MKPKESFDIYECVTNQIITILEQGTIPWRKQWNSRELPANRFTKRPYRGINQLFLACLPYTIPRYLTWKQITQLGGGVKHGERGYMVVYWQVKKTSQTPEHEESSNEEGKRKPKLLLRYYRVFNVAQCFDLPEHITQVSSIGADAQIQPIASCEAVISCMPNPPQIQITGSQPCYIPSLDTIQIPPLNQFESPSAYYVTLFHELIHSTGHKNRLNRDMSDIHRMRSDSYATEELVAEIGSCFLSRHTGILAEEVLNSAAYIAGWIKQLHNDKRLIMQASAKAQNATDYILGSTIPSKGENPL